MMDATRDGKFRLAAILSICVLALGFAGCEGDDGDNGAAGPAGSDGNDGINCWDLNENGVPDFPDEDTNGDGVINVEDCQLPPPSLGDADALHKAYFADNDYQDTSTCLTCHSGIGDDILGTGHWNWAGVTENVDGFEDAVHGKVDFINNFCIAVPTNEGRCTQCHIGYNYADSGYDFDDPTQIDCLVCHDQTGTYVKEPKTAGNPPPDLDLTPIAASVAEASGIPSRKNCIACHAKAGGGDNVKHGDISTDLVATTREYDVHMGTDGGDMACVTCHGADDQHGIGGMPFHSVDEGDMQECTDCHGDRDAIHADTSAEVIIDFDGHDRLACQVCHVPTFARKVATKTVWNWETAGQDIPAEDIPVYTAPDGAEYPLYNKMKGDFEFANSVRPVLRYHNGKWTKTIMNVNDQFVETPVVLSEPLGDYTEEDSMIYPFKKMVGNQVADANNNTMLVPHLFGLKGGDNPYWVAYDWDLALQDGAAYTGQEYTGGYQFVDTEMYLAVNHEVAPSEEAWGMDSNCGDCHGGDQIDWEALGWTGDPVSDQGTRP